MSLKKNWNVNLVTMGGMIDKLSSLHAQYHPGQSMFFMTLILVMTSHMPTFRLYYYYFYQAVGDYNALL